MIFDFSLEHDLSQPEDDLESIQQLTLGLESLACDAHKPLLAARQVYATLLDTHAQMFQSANQGTVSVESAIAFAVTIQTTAQMLGMTVPTIGLESHSVPNTVVALEAESSGIFARVRAAIGRGMDNIKRSLKNTWDSILLTGTRLSSKAKKLRTQLEALKTTKVKEFSHPSTSKGIHQEKASGTEVARFIYKHLDLVPNRKRQLDDLIKLLVDVNHAKKYEGRLITTHNAIIDHMIGDFGFTYKSGKMMDSGGAHYINEHLVYGKAMSISVDFAIKEETLFGSERMHRIVGIKVIQPKDKINADASMLGMPSIKEADDILKFVEYTAHALTSLRKDAETLLADLNEVTYEQYIFKSQYETFRYYQFMNWLSNTLTVVATTFYNASISLVLQACTVGIGYVQAALGHAK